MSLEMLTPREQEIGRMLAQGMRSAEIAARLGVSAATVTQAVYRAAELLGIEGGDARLKVAMRFKCEMCKEHKS